LLSRQPDAASALALLAQAESACRGDDAVANYPAATPARPT